MMKHYLKNRNFLKILHLDIQGDIGKQLPPCLGTFQMAKTGATLNNI